MELFANLVDNLKDFKDVYMGKISVIKALQEERPELAKKLIVKGRDVDMRDGLGNTALHYAAALGFSEVIQLLLEHGANIETENYEGQTPLFYAMEYHQIDEAKVIWSYQQKLNKFLLDSYDNKMLIIDLCSIGVDCSWYYGEANSGFFQKDSASETGHILHPRAVEIGEILNNQGGMKSMLEAHNAIRKLIGNRAASELSSCWHGIGNWLH